MFGIVQQSAGSIEVSGEPGEGTTFKIYFSRTAEPSGGAAKSPSSDPTSRGGNETILLVEDEALVRALARTILTAAGYHVLEAGSEEAALALADRHPAAIHLLLTDVVLPGIGGPQLAEQLRARRPGTRVLFMSGYTNDAAIRHGVVVSAVELLQKPSNRVSLLRRIRGLFEAGRQRI